MSKQRSTISPIYTGQYGTAINRGAAAILSRKKRKQGGKKSKSARKARALAAQQRSARIRRSIEEQKARAFGASPAVPTLGSSKQLSTALKSTRGKAALAGNGCPYCGAVAPNLSLHIEEEHGAEKLVRWALSR